LTKGVADFLREHADKAPVSFHMPGHKGMGLYEENGFGDTFKRLADWDITEISGADNLFQPESIIQKTMEKYERLYGVRRSYLLINGSSGGIIAAILAAVPKGGKLIAARNCHKSVFNALYLGGIEPVYAVPQEEEKYGISGEIRTEEIVRLMEENPDAGAVIIPSPNYYGICSDIESISREVHKRGKILIVDQAHGAHLKFFDSKGMAKAGTDNETAFEFPAAAEDLGADIVINSTHKTLASFTQTAVMNVCSNKVNLSILEDKLQMIESSSPSYPLMATLDINADIIAAKGKELMEEWRKNLQWFYEKSSKIDGLSLMKTSRFDMTKLNIDMSAYGFDGVMLENFLMERGIFPELVSGNLVMCMTGIGNVKSDYERLIDALSELADGYEKISAVKSPEKTSFAGKLVFKKLPAEKEQVHIEEAEGRICAVSLIPYPPGIPAACPGEILTSKLLGGLKSQREAGKKVIGIDENMMLWVGKE